MATGKHHHAEVPHEATLSLALGEKEREEPASLATLSSHHREDRETLVECGK
jgi:hypothetical protein